MNTLTFAHQKKWLLLGLVVLAFLLVACGGTESTVTEEPTAAAETVDETEEPTEAPTEVPTEIPVVEFDGVVADTIPCDAAIIPSERSTLNIRYREPTTQSAVIGAVRPNTPFRIIEMTEIDGVTWYRASNNNTFFGWIEAHNVVLSTGCVTGTGAAGEDAEATEEATEESD